MSWPDACLCSIMSMILLVIVSIVVIANDEGEEK